MTFAIFVIFHLRRNIECLPRQLQTYRGVNFSFPQVHRSRLPHDVLVAQKQASLPAGSKIARNAFFAWLACWQRHGTNFLYTKKNTAFLAHPHEIMLRELHFHRFFHLRNRHSANPNPKLHCGNVPPITPRLCSFLQKSLAKSLPAAAARQQQQRKMAAMIGKSVGKKGAGCCCTRRRSYGGGSNSECIPHSDS